MPGHDMVVIGTSAGGLEQLLWIVRGLPADFPAAICIVQHVAATGPSLLPEILTHAGALPAIHPGDKTPIQRGQIYVAPPDRHMLVRNGHVHTVRGPKENGFRPAIDATFRTAALAYGPRVVGVILTGMLDDGTAGLLAVKRRGGTAIVQDPTGAAFPSMPESALRYVDVDAVLPVADMPALLERLAAEPVDSPGDARMPEDMELEANISDMDRYALDHAETLGVPVPFVCPDCGGVLTEYYDGDLLRFRCQVGHVFSRESMFASHAAALDRSLWAAYQSLDERLHLAQRLAADAHRLGDTASAFRFDQQLKQLAWQKEQVRQALIKDDMSVDHVGES